MNNILKRTTAFLLLGLCILMTIGCTSELTKQGSESNGGTVPPRLYFHSEQELADLRNMLYETDEKLDAYLAEHNYSVNGLSTREQVESFFSKVGDIQVPYITSTQRTFFELLYFPTEGELLGVKMVIDGVCYGFSTYLDRSVTDTNIPDLTMTKLDASVDGRNCILYKTDNSDYYGTLNGLQYDFSVSISASEASGINGDDLNFDVNELKQFKFVAIKDLPAQVTAFGGNAKY